MYIAQSMNIVDVRLSESHSFSHPCEIARSDRIFWEKVLMNAWRSIDSMTLVCRMRSGFVRRGYFMNVILRVY